MLLPLEPHVPVSRRPRSRGRFRRTEAGTLSYSPGPGVLDGRLTVPPPQSLGWTDHVHAPEHLDEGVDTYGNPVTGKWMPKGIDQDMWERIRGATIEGYLGTQSKVLRDFTRACVYTRDYRDLDDLQRILTVLRELGVRGWIDYKRGCDSIRGLYGRGALYWYSPPGTVTIKVPRWSVGREIDTESSGHQPPPPQTRDPTQPECS
ncbi:putative phosphothreonine lyase domain-containing protein [Streptomyces beihaiensis]|uniref:DUF1917 domain-containing protein n=1 Tax=Streptomyces beihaiensis TaxID=2984495 RepID=A0ABT3TWC9_9ACTN|nr:putative phosphothreonine lyase domain-containg protein [Streptomyces beihaiensis]MCX3061355.1 DUF1917 domain-containing protein [Streptomyces beihaiensis]